jgi:hypothetical protein
MARFRGSVPRLIAALVCLLASVQAASAQFETRGSYAAQQEPFAIAVGDFNHDGKLDLAVASTCCPDGGVSILLGNGDGTFRPAVNYNAGVAPVSIVAADFKHDGNLDLAVVSQSGYIGILMGNGDGTFQPATQSPPVQPFEIFLTAGDFNGDGKLDLLAFSNANPCKCISVLLGNGDGTFQNAVITQPSSGDSVVGVGDFNGDGKLDLATAGDFGTQSYVNILLGNGDGTFRQGAIYPGEASPASIAVADFNRDGKQDFAVANSLGTGISVWLGNGDDTFQPAVDYSTPFPIWVATADLNGDGKVDLVAANFGGLPHSPGGASVFLGNGDGTFQAGVFYPAVNEGNFVAVGDFNGDLKPDLVVADRRFDDVVVLLNTGVASFSPTTPLVFAAQLLNTTSAWQTVALTNTGKKALSIASISVRGSFQQSNACGKSLAPAATCDLTVTFKPTAEGTANGLISLNDSASSKPQAIELSGAGTIVELSPQTLNFGDQKVGTKSAPLPVTVTNTGSTTITISGISLGHANLTTFSETNNCRKQLSPAASCTVNVTFLATKTGPINGILKISDNGGGGAQIVPLTGTGD